MINVLVVGSGAREHALAWKIAQSPRVERLYVAPGNPGTAQVATNISLEAIDIDGICRFCTERRISLVVIGPEAPLALGLADALRRQGQRVVGPDAAAARIESSKSFAKDLMSRAGVPTAQYAVFDELAAALDYADTAVYPLVVKADGLAAGKGVVICHAPAEARTALQLMIVDGIFGESGSRVVIEEMLCGPEVSLMALVDGEHAVPLPLAQDHKRLGDGDTGPNTGGMGAYAPVPFVGDAERDALVRLTIQPVVRSLAQSGTPYRGVLFAGLMLTSTGPRVLEYNCRLGDPETQVILPLIDGDLVPWLEAVADGTLTGRIPVLPASTVGVVLAAPGYPEQPKAGAPITGLDAIPEDVLIFHAGTSLDAAGHVVTAGGRVITVVGIAPSLVEAAERAYATPVTFEGMQRRGDIGWRASPPPPAPPPPGGRGVTTGDGISKRTHVTYRHRPYHPPPSKLASPSPPRGGQGGRRGERGRIGVLASGTGTNLQALLDASAAGSLDATIEVVISNHPQAGALERASRSGVPVLSIPLIDRRDPAARGQFEDQLLAALAPYHLDLIVLAGWMLVLSSEFLERCGCPLLNVHPALLPMPDAETLDVPILRGAHAVRDALALGLPYTGVSVHHVTPEVDAGPVICRETVPILPNGDEESLHRRLKAVEHRLLPEAVQSVLHTLSPGGIHA